MTKYLLDMDFRPEFELLGISTILPDYRLCWLLNKTFHLSLKKSDDIYLGSRKPKVDYGMFEVPEENHRFATYSFLNRDNSESVKLIANKSQGRLLLKKFPRTDFFWKVDHSQFDMADYRSGLGTMEQVLAVEVIDPESLKKDMEIFYTND